MHRWLLILVIALLPLRGWVGEAMAGQMLAQHLPATETIAVGAHAERAAGSLEPEARAPDCNHGAAGSSLPADSGEGTCASCTQCLACSALVLPVTAAAVPAIAAHAQPLSCGERFASAPAAPLLKPPIS
jgi:hypothetical protein